MRIATVEPMIVNIPETGNDEDAGGGSGLTAVLVRVETDTGLVGWGEGAALPRGNAESIYDVLRAAIPFAKGRNPWNTQAIADDFFGAGEWGSAWRPGAANYAYAGLDMALWDICGQDCGQPLYNLFGGLRRPWVDYYYPVTPGPTEDVVRQCREAASRGYRVFYLKVGFDLERELGLVAAIRETIGPAGKIRIDANCRWSFNEGLRNVVEFDRYRIDFAEAPVPFEPLRNMTEVRSRTPVAICANEGLGTVGSVWECIRARACDVLCFTPFFVGTLGNYHRLSHAAHLEGIRVCKHTHNETGIALTAAQHILLTLPNVVEGNQQAYQFLSDDVLAEPLPIRTGPRFGPPSGSGLCLRIDEAKVARFRRHFDKHGQYVPQHIRDRANEPPARS
jgi:glucarate dehydratase